MGLGKTSPYLPKSRFEDIFSEFKTRIAYRVWGRKIRRYGGFRKTSSFKILEVGCGPGYFLRYIERRFPACKIYGLDVNEALLDFAGKHINKARLFLYDGQQLPFHKDTFDVVCAIQVVEHIEDPTNFFMEAKGVLKIGGLLAIATPNPKGIPARMLKDKWPGYRFDHISLKIPQQWRRIMEDCGFQILDDGTTGLTGFRVLQKLPFALVNWIPMAIFGYFPWYKGESYMAVARNIS